MATVQNLTTEAGVKAYMEESTSADDWNARCNEVKAAHDGDYPSFWYMTIVMSGVAGHTARKWGGSAEIKISSF